MLKNRPSESIVNTKFWDWRFRFYYVKKLYNARLVELGFAVLQADTDTVRTQHDSPTRQLLPRLRLLRLTLTLTLPLPLTRCGRTTPSRCCAR